MCNRLRKKSFWRLLTPSLADVFFVALLLAAFLRPGGLQALLADGDTGWHIRTGELILASGSAPSVDPYSFSRPGQPWFAWEWLADVLFARAWQWRGIGEVAAVAGVALCLAAVALLLWLLRRGAGLWIAAGITLAVFSASSMHYLARPHVFSILLYTLSLWALDEDRRRPGPWIWLLVPAAALWASLHGGFVALLATLALAAAVSALERRWGRARRYGALTSLCLAATCLNPYGWRLHLHIVQYLSSPWILDHVQEFQSPVIRSEGMVVFAVLLVGGLAMASRRLARGEWFEGALALVWGFAALRSARHIPFFAIAAAPAIASEGALWWRGIAERGAAAPPSVLRHSGGARDRLRVRALVAGHRGACAATLGAANLLGSGAGPGPCAACQRLAGALRGRGAGDGGERGRFPQHAFSGAGGGTQPAAAGVAGAGPADSDIGSMGRLPDFPLLSAAAGVFRRPKRLLWPGPGGRLHESGGGPEPVPGIAGPVPVRSGAAAARLAAQHRPGRGCRMEAGVSGPGRNAVCPPDRTG